MLKTYPTSFLLPKRLKLVSLAGRLDPDGTGVHQTSTMSNDATLPDPRPQQPMLASQRAKQQQHVQARQPPATYFPLGYKEAAQQWVCPNWPN